jgi:hypothetical protein
MLFGKKFTAIIERENRMIVGMAVHFLPKKSTPKINVNRK